MACVCFRNTHSNAFAYRVLRDRRAYTNILWRKGSHKPRKATVESASLWKFLSNMDIVPPWSDVPGERAYVSADKMQADIMLQVRVMANP